MCVASSDALYTLYTNQPDYKTHNLSKTSVKQTGEGEAVRIQNTQENE